MQILLIHASNLTSLSCTLVSSYMTAYITLHTSPACELHMSGKELQGALLNTFLTSFNVFSELLQSGLSVFLGEMLFL